MSLIWRVTVSAQSNQFTAQTLPTRVFVFSMPDPESSPWGNLFPVIWGLAQGQKTDKGGSEIPN